MSNTAGKNSSEDSGKADLREIAFEILPPDHQDRDKLMAAVAKIMDDLIRIPGTRWHIGLDPLVGLVPGLGDGVANVVSAVALFHASRGGLPRLVLMRMSLNILVNALFGAIPFFGDALSFWFKSNRRNYKLLVENVGKRKASPGDLLIVALTLTILVGILILVAIGVATMWIGVGKWFAELLGSRPQ